MLGLRRSQVRAFVSVLLGLCIITLVINNTSQPHELWIKANLQNARILELEAETVTETDPSINAPDTTTTAESYSLPTGEFPRGYRLKGLVFAGNTPIGGNYSKEFESYITTSVVRFNTRFRSEVAQNLESCLECSVKL